MSPLADEDWRVGIKQLMEQQDAKQLVRLADAKKIARYVLVVGELYRRGFATPLPKCLSEA